MRCTRRRTLLLSRHVSSCATNDQFVHIVTPKPCMLLVHGIRILDSRGAPFTAFSPNTLLYLPLLGAVDRILRPPLSRGSWLIDGEGNVLALCVSLFFFFFFFFFHVTGCGLPFFPPCFLVNTAGPRYYVYVCIKGIRNG